eukprot:g2714.t1
MPKHTSEEAYIREINSRPKAAMGYSEQMFWSSAAERGNERPERDLLSTMSYMASVAFYAGKTPTQFVDELHLDQNPDQLGVEELLTDGTHFLHLNKTELHKTMRWVVKIHLKDALHLIDRDVCVSSIRTHSFVLTSECVQAMIRNESDPFVVFQSGISMVKSQMKYDQVDARWNTTHYLFIRKKSIWTEDDDKMRVYLFDGDKLFGRDKMSLSDMQDSDDLIASTEVDLELSSKDTSIKDFPLTFNQKRNRFAKKMTLNFSTQLLTIDDFCKEIGRSGDEHWLDAHVMENPTVDWMKLFEKIKLPHVNLHPTICFENKASSTQGWIHTLREKKVMIVAFKGTDVSEWKDVVTDLKFCKASLTPMAKGDSILTPSRVLRDDDNKVHMGFRDSYVSVRESILEAIYSVTRWSHDWLVVLTGHSLGGALATIAAFEVANRWHHGTRPRVAMINFGSPRVGNEAFVENYAKTVPVSFRFRHCSDIIPCFPPNLCHVDHVVKGNPDGSLTVIYHEQGEMYGDHTHKENKEDQTLREAVANHPDIVHHQQRAYYQQIQGAISKVFNSFSES